MNVFWHAATAAPLLIMGYPIAALGAVAPDITWVHNEIRFRRSGEADWYWWAYSNLCFKHVVLYKIAHSFLCIVPVCVAMGWYEFLIGWLIHVALDLPTHRGCMQQQPLFPFQWRWPWLITKNM